MIETLVSWTIGALLGTLLGRARRERRRRAAARARQGRAARVMLDELSAFATGLDLAIEHASMTPIADPTAGDAAWSASRRAQGSPGERRGRHRTRRQPCTEPRRGERLADARRRAHRHARGRRRPPRALGIDRAQPFHDRTPRAVP